MYNNKFQYGKTVDLLSINEKDSINNWSTPTNLKRAYDKTCKGFVYVSPM